MKKIWSSSALFIGTLAICLLAFLGYTKDQDTALQIATIALGIAGARCVEGIKKP